MIDIATNRVGYLRNGEMHRLGRTNARSTGVFLKSDKSHNA